MHNGTARPERLHKSCSYSQFQDGGQSVQVVGKIVKVQDLEFYFTNLKAQTNRMSRY